MTHENYTDYNKFNDPLRTLYSVSEEDVRQNPSILVSYSLTSRPRTVIDWRNSFMFYSHLNLKKQNKVITSKHDVITKSKDRCVTLLNTRKHFMDTDLSLFNLVLDIPTRT